MQSLRQAQRFKLESMFGSHAKGVELEVNGKLIGIGEGSSDSRCDH